MRIPTIDLQSLLENGVPDFSTFKNSLIEDEGVIENTKKGNTRNFTIIINQKYEILSLLAIQAICDEYYRESVANFASSLERLFEFYIRVTFEYHEIGKNEFDSFWKPLSNSSERQFGAFFSTYLLEEKHNFNYIDNKSVNFRNKVIHKGYIPNYNEVIDYGQKVCDCSKELTVLLSKEKYIKSLRKITHEHILNRKKYIKDKYKNDTTTSTINIPCPFAIDRLKTTSNLSDMIQEHKNRPDFDKAEKFFSVFGKYISTLINK